MSVEVRLTVTCNVGACGSIYSTTVLHPDETALRAAAHEKGWRTEHTEIAIHGVTKKCVLDLCPDHRDASRMPDGWERHLSADWAPYTCAPRERTVNYELGPGSEDAAPVRPLPSLEEIIRSRLGHAAMAGMPGALGQKIRDAVAAEEARINKQVVDEIIRADGQEGNGSGE